MTANQHSQAISCQNVSFGYAGRVLVSNLNFTVQSGDAVALIGPNGSGKSTLINGILGIAQQFGGHLSVLGTTPKLSRTQIGTLPQADARNTALPITAQQVVTMGLYRSMSALSFLTRNDRAAVRDALQRVGLAQFAGKLFGELSGGQQQRVILARALVAKPRLLLLDEPFNGLDSENRRVLLRLLRELSASNVTVLVSTHDLEIAHTACTHVLQLGSGHAAADPGRQLAYGTHDCCEL